MDAILFLSTKFGTESPRERLALDYLLPKLYEAYADTIQSILLDSLESETYAVKTFALAMCGKLKIKKQSKIYILILMIKIGESEPCVLNN